ncbi:MAG: thermosome subunit beta [Candidatus Aenigmarchaeota archaeon]|nr:TCP-1/cpn60 chaperonin family protein [Candidatus Aenigmarchaeota archaeon]MDW8159869.1 thermosome subunit beta [Candidatus Aenigmarchaeota archaeon]
MAQQAYVAQIGGQPVLILPEGTLRSTGKDAQRNNIAAAKAVADIVRTTLGPKGMDKMLVDSIGDITITNDGVTILEEMEVEHPAAKMMVEVAKTQNEEVGDGTTSAVIIAGELLKRAEELLDQDIHPTVIIKGYQLAKEEALRVLEEIATPINLKEEDNLKKIVITAMSGKTGKEAAPKIAEIIVSAVKTVVEERDGKLYVNKDNIKRVKKHGASVLDTELVNGVVVDKEFVHPQMPKVVKNAKIALLDCPLEIEKTETDAQIRITSPEQLQAFLQQEQRMIKEMVEKIAKTGANVVITEKGIDDLAQHYLAKRGIVACRRVKRSDLEALAKATGARIVSNLDDLSEKDLGFAEVVEEKKIAGEAMTFVKGCKNPKAVTILVRGSTEHVVDEIDRNVEDGIGALVSAIESGKVVPGGGAIEAELAKRIREFAEKFSGREQLAIQEFANALEIIPRTLAENAGLDPIDILVELRAAHEHGKVNHGIDVFEGKIKDVVEMGVIEPLKVKTQAIKSAAEAAEMILRIDDVIAAGKLGKEKESKKTETPSENEY